MNSDEKNTMKGMMQANYKDTRISKDAELNETMSIAPSGSDELTSHLRNAGNNGGSK